MAKFNIAFFDIWRKKSSSARGVQRFRVGKEREGSKDGVAGEESQRFLERGLELEWLSNQGDEISCSGCSMRSQVEGGPSGDDVGIWGKVRF
jgi:hypothetical protein